MDRRSDQFRAHPDFPSTSPPAPAPVAFECAEYRGILTALSRELCQPLLALREGFIAMRTSPQSGTDSDPKTHLGTMIALCDDLIRVTRGYLDCGRRQHSSRHLHLGKYTLSAVVRELDRQFTPEAAARALGWECEVEGPDGTVTTDASRCQELLGQLVANLLQSTPEGGRLAVSARFEADQWTITLTQSRPASANEPTGRPVTAWVPASPEQQELGEEPILGLALCRALADQLGGQLTLAADPGQHTTVRVELPTEPRSAARS